FSQSGLTDEEVKFMRLAVGQQDALKYETPSQKAGLLSNIVALSLDEDYLQQRNQIVETVSKETLNELSKKWFDPNDYQIIVVGDAASLRPQLEKLDIPIEELEIIR
ncbi:insulinase family protein, partial [Vibrio lentus]